MTTELTVRSRPDARPSLVQRLVCLSLVYTLVGLPLAPAFAEEYAGTRIASSGNGPIVEVGPLVPETSLQRTVRLLRTPGREREAIETLGIDLTTAPLPQATAQPASVDDGRDGGLPWWAWLAIGAGAGWAATQIEFGDDDDDGEIDDD